MFLILVIIIVVSLIIMAFCTPPSDNKDTTKKEKTENDDFEDFIIFEIINKLKRKDIDILNTKKEVLSEVKSREESIESRL